MSSTSIETNQVNHSAHRAAPSSLTVEVPSSSPPPKTTLAMTTGEEKSSPTGVDQLERPRSTDPVASTMMNEPDELVISTASVLAGMDARSPTVELRRGYKMPVRIVQDVVKVLPTGKQTFKCAIDFIAFLIKRQLQEMGRTEFYRELNDWGKNALTLSGNKDFLQEVERYALYLRDSRYHDYLNPDCDAGGNGVRCTAWMGNLFAIAGLGGVIKVFAVDSTTHKRTLVRSFTEEATNGAPLPPIVTTIKFMANGKKIVYGLDTGSLVVRNILTGRIEFGSYFPNTRVNSVSCYQNYVVVGTTKRAPNGDKSGTLTIFNVDTGMCVVERDLESTVECVAFSRDGTLVASGGSDRVVNVWTLMWALTKSNQSPFGGTPGMFFVKTKTLKNGHQKNVMSVDFSPNGSLLVSGSMDCGVVLWCLNSMIALKRTKHEHAVTSVAFSQCGRYYLSASFTEIISTGVYVDLLAPYTKRTPSRGSVSTCMCEVDVDPAETAVKVVRMGYFFCGSLLADDRAALKFDPIPQLLPELNRLSAGTKAERDKILREYSGSVIRKKTKKAKKDAAVDKDKQVAKRKCVTSNRPEAKRVALPRRALPPVPSGASAFSPIQSVQV